MIRLVSKIAFVFLFVFLLPSVSIPAENTVLVIANKHFPSDSISLSDLKKVYLGKKKHQGRYKLTPFDLKDNTAVKTAFIGKVMASTLGRYKAYWLKQQFREGNTPPRILHSTEDMLRAVRGERGAIGYLRKEDFKADLKIKVLLILD